MRYAPCHPVLLEGEALAWAAANRSAAFYQEKQFRQAIEDIEVNPDPCANEEHGEFCQKKKNYLRSNS